MALGLRQVVVLLLVLAQLALGAGTGGVVCLGEADSHESGAGQVCSHDCGEEGWPLPTPVQPHGHDDECGCIDVPSPLGRADEGRVVRELSPALVLLLTPFAPAPSRVPAGVGFASPRPPGPAPGGHSVRLLI